MNISEYTQLRARDPKIAKLRKENTQKICELGKADIERKLYKLRERFQYQKSDVRWIKTTDEVPGTYRTTNKKGKVAKTEYIPDTTTHATTALSYHEYAAYLFWQHDATWYFNEAVNGTGFRKVNAIAILEQAIIAGS